MTPLSGSVSGMRARRLGLGGSGSRLCSDHEIENEIEIEVENQIEIEPAVCRRPAKREAAAGRGRRRATKRERFAHPAVSRPRSCGPRSRSATGPHPRKRMLAHARFPENGHFSPGLVPWNRKGLRKATREGQGVGNYVRAAGPMRAKALLPNVRRREPTDRVAAPAPAISDCR